MKTIHQAKWDFVENKFPYVQEGEIPHTIKHQRNICIDAFEAGVKFAQEWININNELPDYDITVLLKFVYGSFEVGYYLHHRERERERE